MTRSGLLFGGGPLVRLILLGRYLCCKSSRKGSNVVGWFRVEKKRAKNPEEKNSIGLASHEEDGS